MKHVMTALVGIYACAGACFAETIPEMKLETKRDRTNYSVGYQIGGDFKKQGVELSPESLLRGIQDSLAGRTPLLPVEEMRSVLVELKKKIVDDEKNKRERYRADGLEFLKANAGKEGVKTLPSGLQYKVLREGAGRSPTLADTVSVNYRGTLVDGTEFNSSFSDGKPAVIPLSGVIPGWKEALPLMKEGAKWLLFIPPDLAFGERGPLADRTVLYEIELLAVNPPEKK